MDRNLLRAYLVELLGAFALVYFGAGVVCVDYLTTPAEPERGSVAAKAPAPQTGAAPLLQHQPGLVGIALAQGLILAVVLSVTVPVSGGYLNPAVTLTLWVFNRLDHVRTAWFIGAQLLASQVRPVAPSAARNSPNRIGRFSISL